MNRTPTSTGGSRGGTERSSLEEKEWKAFQKNFRGQFGRLSDADAAFDLEFFRSLDKNQIHKDSSVSWPPVRPGYLDLFSGERGVARCMVEKGYTWAITYDLAHGSSPNPNSPTVRAILERLVRCGIFLNVGMSPVCSSFSVAITPAVRTKEQPEGVDSMSEKMRAKIWEGNDMCAWTLTLLLISGAYNIFFWVENPAGSWFFRQKRWIEMLEKFHARVGFWILDYCRYGTPWRKRTKIRANSSLKNRKTLCNRTHRHLALRGRSKVHRKSWTLNCCSTLPWWCVPGYSCRDKMEQARC